MLEKKKKKKYQFPKARAWTLVQHDPHCAPLLKQSRSPDSRGQDRTQNSPQLSARSAKDFEDYILKLGHLPTIKCFQYLAYSPISFLFPEISSVKPA